MQLTNQLRGEPAQCHALVILCGDVIFLQGKKKDVTKMLNNNKKNNNYAFSSFTLKLVGPMP